MVDSEPMEGFYFVLTVPHVGMEEEYHRWYEARHIPDILSVPGVSFARRFALLDATDGGQATGVYAALYGFRDIEQAVSQIVARRGTELLQPSASVDRTKNRSCVFEGHLSQVARLCEGSRLSLLLQGADEGSVALSASASDVVAIAARVQATSAPASYAAIRMSALMASGASGAVEPPAQGVSAYVAQPISPFFHTQ